MEPEDVLLPSPRCLWQAAHQQVLAGQAEAPAGPGQALSGPWRLLLLGDGSPTRHLESLTGLPVEVELIAMAPERPDPGPLPSAAISSGPSGPEQDPPAEVAELSGPLLRRQVWLRCGATPLAWAESWWNQREAEQHLHRQHQPIWRNLTRDRAELFREVDGLALVQADWLDQRFQHGGPFWSRHYRFFRGGRALTVIREVFSPELERWLGPATQGPQRGTPETRWGARPSAL